MTQAIPVIDIAGLFSADPAARATVGRALDRACTDLGFLIVSGHGVPDSLVERIRSVSRQFFALPLEDKKALAMPPDRYRGYIAPGNEALAYSLDDVTPPDLKESFSTGPHNVPDNDYSRSARPANFFAANMWPDVPGFRTTWEEYYAAMEQLAGTLMRGFALGLGLPETYFDAAIDRHITNFSVLHYPPQTIPPLPGQLRAGAHTDYGSLTILKTDESPGGLQVHGLDGAWIDVPFIPGTFVVNLGDLMAEWTNDRWRSTLHRVVNPPAEAGAAADRISMAFFHQPNYDAVIECLPTCTDAAHPPKYGRTTSGEHVWAKITKHRTPEIVDG